MNFLLCLVVQLLPSLVFCQINDKSLYLFHNLKQDGEQLQFYVLSADKKQVKKFDKQKNYYWFKAQKVIQTQGGASGVLLNGSYEAFYSNKQLVRKGVFVKGLKHGEWLYWTENGILALKENWKKGKQLGEQLKYSAQGDISERLFYKSNGHKRITKDSISYYNKKGNLTKFIGLSPYGKIIRIEKYTDTLVYKKTYKYNDGKRVLEEEYKWGRNNKQSDTVNCTKLKLFNKHKSKNTEVIDKTSRNKKEEVLAQPSERERKVKKVKYKKNEDSK